MWWALAVSTVPAIALLLFSLTVDARTFAVMLLIAEAFVALMLFMGWARAERLRVEAELRGDPLDYDRTGLTALGDRRGPGRRRRRRLHDSPPPPWSSHTPG